MKKEQFSELIRRYQEGSASSEEKELIENWLAYREEENAYGQFSEGEIKRIKESIKWGVDHHIKGNRGSRHVRLVRIRVAAAILFLITLGVFLKYGAFRSQANITVEEVYSTGDVKKVILSDGSIVWLKGESTLTYPDEFHNEERIVKLEGEALFEITKDYTEPGFWDRIRGEKSVRKSFVVKSGSLETRVLGTSFNIKTSKKETEVYVLTGRVEVHLGEENSLELLPNERSLYEHDKQELTKLEQESLSMDSIRKEPAFKQYTEGTEYDMYFENMELGEVAKRISDKFDVAIIVEEAMKNCLIRADFTDQSLENTLELISETLNGSFRIEDDKVNLLGKGCN